MTSHVRTSFADNENLAIRSDDRHELAVHARQRLARVRGGMDDTTFDALIRSVVEFRLRWPPDRV